MTGASPQTGSDLLNDGLAALGISSDFAAQLLGFVNLIVRWNRVHNLTAVRDPVEMIPLHLLDSLAVVRMIPAGARVLDVGTGPGLPGIPLAIVRPDLTITLLDSNGKKTAFIREAIARLALSNATVVTARAEQWQPGRRFDVIISRALAELRNFTGWTRHLLEVTGCWIAMKGTSPLAELAQLPRDIDVVGIRRLTVPHLAGERHAVILRPSTTPPESAP